MDDVLEQLDRAFSQLWLQEGPACKCGVCAMCKAKMQASTLSPEENEFDRAVQRMPNDKKAAAGKKIVSKSVIKP
ncbi:MAG: hypothetical protein CL779_00770 [Chloroflexi bacterium]|nr:hypothetical protein [Chloroflexota bacterium]